MPSGTTPNIGLTLPTIFGDAGSWGNEVNQNFVLIDEALGNVGGAGEITITVGSSPITLTEDQARATIINFVPGMLLGGTFTVIMPVGPKNPFVISNQTSQVAMIQSVSNVNSFTLQPSQSGFFYQDSNDIAIYGQTIFVEGVEVSGNPVLFSSATIIGYFDQGGGQVQLRKAGGTGGNLVDFPPLFNASVGSLKNKTLLIMVPSGMTRAWASFPVAGIGFQVVVKTGLLTIGHARLFSTGALDMGVTGRTGLVAFNGVTSNIDIDATGGIAFVTCDNLPQGSMDFSNGGDWYIAIYFANVSNNDTATIGQTTNGVTVPEGLIAGDLVNTNVGAQLNGGTPITSYASHSLVTWIEDTGV